MRKAGLMAWALVLGTASPQAHASAWIVGSGYNFIRQSAYVSLDYRKGQLAGEAFLMSMGGEEPTTNPGPELSLDALGYLPWLPVFGKIGVVAGWKKYGENIGCGVDLPITHYWLLRLQDTFFHATEDQHRNPETENILSVGAHYRF